MNHTFLPRAFASLAFLLSTCVFQTGSAAAQDGPQPGIWTNTEDQYFAQDEGRERPDWLAVELAENGEWRALDVLGGPIGGEEGWQAGPVPGIAPRAGGGWEWKGSELRRARPFTCWISVRKFAGKPDGSEDWTFASNLPIFDQGGRIFMAGNGEAPDVTLRMRNVTWARGSRHKPALVVYMHRDDPERAESYSWTSPDATLVGINLRWVQAGCSPAGDDGETN